MNYSAELWQNSVITFDLETWIDHIHAATEWTSGTETHLGAVAITSRLKTCYHKACQYMYLCDLHLSE